MDVVIVESPAKAKTINKYLGPGYKVLASYGHVRDLPAKDGSVRPDEDFAMSGRSTRKSAKRLTDIAEAVKGADKLILATDPDREGEAISWHVLRGAEAARSVLKDKPVSASSSTPSPSSRCSRRCANPRQIDEPLVDAYLARRALDYLVGFTLSPVLWRKLPGARSAGRVQSVALRLVCDREAEIERFKPAGILDRSRATLRTPRSDGSRRASTALDGKKLEKLDIGDEAQADAATRRSRRATFTRRLGRSEAGQAQPAAALHHLDPAAGGLAQARLRRQPHHAGRAAALRRRRHRRRDGRPDHLYAYRRRADSRPRRSTPARAADRREFGAGIPAGEAARLHDQGQERAGGARGDPPDRPRPHARRCRAIPRYRPGAGSTS